MIESAITPLAPERVRGGICSEKLLPYLNAYLPQGYQEININVCILAFQKLFWVARRS